MDKTLKQHLAEALAKRWASKTPEQRKEYSAKMHKARYSKKVDDSPLNP